jgi:hypothetical protein
MKFFVCDCYAHALCVSTDEPEECEPCCYLTFWYHSYVVGRAPLWERITQAWKVLQGKQQPGAEIILKKATVRELIAHLQEIEPTLKDW